MTQSNYSSTFLFVLLSTFLIGGCGDKLTPPEKNTGDHSPGTFSGTIVNESGKPIPEDAGIIVLWFTPDSQGDGYMYVFGQGTIDQGTNTFAINLEPPPAEALQGFYPEVHFGVGYIFVAPDSVISSMLRQGKLYDGIEDLYGTTDFSNIIYLADDPEELNGIETCQATWLRQFPQGYSFGHGLSKNDVGLDCKYDGFIPASSDSIRLILTSDEKRITLSDWI